MEIDITRWSGDGDFTRRLVEALGAVPAIARVRVEDAPASRAEAGYAFLSNEVYVAFATQERVQRIPVLGRLAWRRRVREAALTVGGLGDLLAADERIGPADYGDEGMLQYLRTERIVPPYQTKGYKLVEMVRIYAAGTPPRR